MDYSLRCDPKIRIFTKNECTQSVHFWSDFDLPFPPEDDRKTLAIELSKYLKIKALSPLPFPGKNTISFCSISAVFCEKKGHGHMFKGRNQNLTQPFAVLQYLGIFQ